MPKRINEYTLYIWRYQISYVIISLLIGLFLIAAVYLVPGEISQAEQLSAIESSDLSLNLLSNDVINLPYKLLQRLSFTIFGITSLSIKLPSLLLGLLSIVGIIVLIKHWIHDNVAIITVLIVATASQFIFASQNGTPDILYVLLPTLMMIFALRASRFPKQRGLWEVLLIMAVALSLYTPLSVYIILALASAAILHPHLRFILGQLPRYKIIAAGLVGIIMLLPLAISLVYNPSLGLTLLGIPTETPNIIDNAQKLAYAYFDFLPIESGSGILPMYSLSSILLAVLGLTRLFITRYTARSFIIIGWLILLIPISLINPSKTMVSFVPIMLLIATGIDVLLHRWYRLFPRNPYARVAGLIPIIFLVVGISLTGVERYFYSYRYSPQILAEYSNDLNLVNKVVSDNQNQPIKLIVDDSEQPFYQAVASHSEYLEVVDAEQAKASPNQSLIITREAYRAGEFDQPDRIVTSSRSEESDRLYLYKITNK